MKQIGYWDLDKALSKRTDLSFSTLAYEQTLIDALLNINVIEYDENGCLNLTDLAYEYSTDDVITLLEDYDFEACFPTLEEVAL